MKKKNDKIVMMLIVLLVFFVLSWIIEAGTFNLGLYNSQGFTRLGLIDLIAVVFSSFTSKVDYMFLFVVGGVYGVLSQTKAYRKLVDKTAEKVSHNPSVAMAVITLFTGLYASICNEVLTLFCIAPFLVSVFLRDRHDKLTAFSAGFGGIIIGILGITFGMYGVGSIYTITGASPGDMIWLKLLVFVIAYILYNVFAIRHMQNHCDKDNSKSDIFCPEELDETEVKRRYRVNIVPFVVWGVVALLLVGLAYISWTDSFGITFFSDLHSSFQSLVTIGDLNVFESLYGVTAKAFGAYDALLFAIFVMLVFSIIAALMEKMKVHTYMAYFGLGMKKIAKVVFMYGLAYAVVVIAMNFPWPNTIVHWMFGEGFDNVLLLLPMAFIAQIFVGNLGMFGTIHGSFIAYAFADIIGPASFLWRLGGAFAVVVAPTSYLLLSLLTYLDIPYVEWLKYIWKFVLSFLFVVLLVLVVVIFI